MATLAGFPRVSIWRPVIRNRRRCFIVVFAVGPPRPFSLARGLCRSPRRARSGRCWSSWAWRPRSSESCSTAPRRAGWLWVPRSVGSGRSREKLVGACGRVEQGVEWWRAGNLVTACCRRAAGWSFKQTWGQVVNESGRFCPCFVHFGSMELTSPRCVGRVFCTTSPLAFLSSYPSWNPTRNIATVTVGGVNGEHHRFSFFSQAAALVVLTVPKWIGLHALDDIQFENSGSHARTDLCTPTIDLARSHLLHNASRLLLSNKRWQLQGRVVVGWLGSGGQGVVLHGR